MNTPTTVGNPSTFQDTNAYSTSLEGRCSSGYPEIQLGFKTSLCEGLPVDDMQYSCLYACCLCYLSTAFAEIGEQCCLHYEEYTQKDTYLRRNRIPHDKYLSILGEALLPCLAIEVFSSILILITLCSHKRSRSFNIYIISVTILNFIDVLMSISEEIDHRTYIDYFVFSCTYRITKQLVQAWISSSRSWLLVSLTMEGLVATVRPINFRMWHSAHKTIIIIVSICFTALVINLHIPWSFFDKNCLMFNDFSIFDVGDLSYYSKKAYSDKYIYELVIFTFLTNFILPFLCLVIFNSSLCVLLFLKARQAPQSSQRNGNDGMSLSSKAMIKTIMMCTSHLIMKGSADLITTVTPAYNMFSNEARQYQMFLISISNCLRRLDYVFLVLILFIWKLKGYCQKICCKESTNE